MTQQDFDKLASKAAATPEYQQASKKRRLAAALATAEAKRRGLVADLDIAIRLGEQSAKLAKLATDANADVRYRQATMPDGSEKHSDRAQKQEAQAKKTAILEAEARAALASHLAKVADRASRTEQLNALKRHGTAKEYHTVLGTVIAWSTARDAQYEASLAFARELGCDVAPKDQAFDMDAVKLAAGVDPKPTRPDMKLAGHDEPEETVDPGDPDYIRYAWGGNFDAREAEA